MKTKFTRRSAKDKDLVTVSLAQLDVDNDPDYACSIFAGCVVGAEVVLVVEGVPTLFILSRPDENGSPTAATTRCFPRFLRLPRVGRPVYADVSEIR